LWRYNHDGHVTFTIGIRNYVADYCPIFMHTYDCVVEEKGTFSSVKSHPRAVTFSWWGDCVPKWSLRYAIPPPRKGDSTRGWGDQTKVNYLYE